MEGRKRKRQTSNGAANPSTSSPRGSSSNRHPAPPPPPPQSLVDLLQSDAAVLRYFASLQSNLEADVGAWRDKAQKYKREAVALRRKLEQAENERRHRKREECDGSDSSDADHDSDASFDAARKKESAGAHRSKKTQLKAKESANTNGNKKSSSKSTRRKKKDDDATSAIPMVQGRNGEADIDQTAPFEDYHSKRISGADRAAILSQLDEAYRCLERLGVSLVDESYASAPALASAPAPAPIPAPGADPPCDNIDSDAIGEGERHDEGSAAEKTDPAAPSLILTRRSDHDVAADLMRSLRSLVRVSTRISVAAASSDGGDNRDFARKYEPFPSRSTDGGVGGGNNGHVNGGSSGNGAETLEMSACLPCCHEMLADQHPAADGLGVAIRALNILDTFCGAVLGDCSWDELFEESDDEANAVADVDNNSTTDNESTRRDMKLEHIRQGMRGRKDLVNSIVLSLRGEITTRWAVEDRLARSDVGALLFDDAYVNPSDDDGDNDNDDNDTGVAKASLQSFDSRSYNRLALLVDRVMYARIISAIYQNRCRYDLVEKVVFDFIISAMLSFGAEDYPHNSPVLSFCVLEALVGSNNGAGNSWFRLFKKNASNFLTKALQLCIQSTRKIWTDRAKSTDGRIRDVSRVELAALNRILQNKSEKTDPLDEEEAARQARDISSVIVEQLNSTDAQPDETSALPLFLSLILIGDFELVAETSTKVKLKLDSADEGGRFVFSCMLLACCQAFQAIRCRNSGADSTANDVSANLDSMLENLDTTNKSSSGGGTSMYLPILAQCSAVLANGLGIHKAASHTTMKTKRSMQVSEMVDSSSSIPMIRVINLERRSDRWNAIVDQARASQLLVVRGPASLVEPNNREDEAYWGNYAFDGRGDVDFTKTRSTLGDTSIRLNDYVASHWLPCELSVFDKNAKEEEVSVPASATERACALSHVASWKGVERSLRSIEPSISQQRNAPSLSAVAENSSVRLLRISGFASGPALLHENRAMGPVPVCVILEDDAVLVDRFRDRLATLLCELPRDFHFCSLGYGRPKNAPMIEFSETVGIPTFLWYMTGYILSMEGARLLLDGLPVVGPVDSWVGLKISSNWENEYGYAVGVGRDARKSAKKAEMGSMQNISPSGASTSNVSNVLAHKDLARLMKFRAFAALVPLCSQKVGQGHVAGGADASGAGASGGIKSQGARNQQRMIAKWRDRDSDIVYSGVQQQHVVGGKKSGVPKG